MIRRTALAALLSLAVVPEVSAQQPPGMAIASLEDLMRLHVTTATRSAEDLSRVPARMQVVTDAQIQRRGYRSLVDVLKDLPDFHVDFAGDQDYPIQLTVDGVRGADKVVVLLDGVRIGSPTNEPLPILANYPVHTAKQIEIVYGPASALYGADAFSAVINIITKDPREASGWSAATSVGQFGLVNQTASGLVSLGSNASLVVAGQALYDRQPDLSRYYPEDFAGIESLRTGTFDSIFGPMTSSRPVSPAYGNTMWAHSQQASLRAGALSFTIFHSQERTPNSSPTRPSNSVYNDEAFQQNELLVAAGTLTRAIGGAKTLTTLSFSRHEMNPESGYWNVFSNFTRSYKYAYGTMAKAEEQIVWKTSPSTTMTVGGTYERFFAIPQTADFNAPVESRSVPGTLLGTTIVDDFYRLRYSNVGGFAQAQYEPTAAVAFTVGGRADYNTRYGSTFNPRVGVVAHPRSGTTAKLLYGTAFIAPSPYQAYAHYGSFVTSDGGATFSSDYWHLPNPDLRPQQKKTIEVALTQSVGSDVSVSASTFYSSLTNLIQTADPRLAHAGTFHGWPVSYIDFPVNEGRNSAYGGTFGVDYLHTFALEHRLEAHAAVTVADGHTWNDESPTGQLKIGGMSPFHFRGGVDLDWSAWSFAPRLTIVGTQRVGATEATGAGLQRLTLPGYTTVDLSARRRAIFKKLTAFVLVENALDRRYRAINMRAYSNPEEFVGAPQNPRRLTVGLELGMGGR